ncbi:MAG: hypothetical protein VXA00_10660, partial [Rhodospirillales bacterium]
MNRPNRLQSLVDLMDDLNHGRISSLEATQGRLETTRSWQPAINAFVSIDEEQAIKSANNADA